MQLITFKRGAQHQEIEIDNNKVQGCKHTCTEVTDTEGGLGNVGN